MSLKESDIKKNFLLVEDTTTIHAALNRLHTVNANPNWFIFIRSSKGAYRGMKASDLVGYRETMGTAFYAKTFGMLPKKQVKLIPVQI
jgi:hypothetical protein